MWMAFSRVPSQPFTTIIPSVGFVSAKQVGVHGIVIKFNDDRGSKYSATFLPEVAAEQGGRYSTAENLSRQSFLGPIRRDPLDVSI